MSNFEMEFTQMPTELSPNDPRFAAAIEYASFTKSFTFVKSGELGSHGDNKLAAANTAVDMDVPRADSI